MKRTFQLDDKCFSFLCEEFISIMKNNERKQQEGK